MFCYLFIVCFCCDFLCNIAMHPLYYWHILFLHRIRIIFVLYTSLAIFVIYFIKYITCDEPSHKNERELLGYWFFVVKLQYGWQMSGREKGMQWMVVRERGGKLHQRALTVDFFVILIFFVYMSCFLYEISCFFCCNCNNDKKNYWKRVILRLKACVCIYACLKSLPLCLYGAGV